MKISYSMPYEEFVCVAEFPHTCSLSAKRTNRVVERLFVPIHQKEQTQVIEDLFGSLYTEDMSVFGRTHRSAPTGSW